MVKVAENAYHVVTYAQIAGQEGEDVVAHRRVQVPAGAGVEGDVCESVLSQVQNHQCHGEASTDNCTRLHANAVERVRARLMNHDGKIGVFWRKYHPLVGEGSAEPGKPLRLEQDGITVRVEVRKIVDDADEVYTGERVSEVKLKLLEKDWAAQGQRFEQRMQVRNVRAQFEDVDLAAAREQLEEYRTQFRDLPMRAEIDSALQEAKQQIDAAEQTVRAMEADALQKLAQDANAGAAFQAAFAQKKPQLAKCFAPLEVIKKDAGKLIEVQTAVRKLLDLLQGVLSRLEEGREAYGKVAWDRNRATSQSRELEALMKKTQGGDALAQLPGVLAELEAHRGRAEENRASLERAIERERNAAELFQARVDTLRVWRETPERGVSELLAFVDAAGGFPSFPVRYWREQAQAMVDRVREVPDVGDVRYGESGALKKLETAEKALAPVMQFYAGIDDDLRKHADEVYAKAVTPQVVFTPPSAWIKVDRVHPRGACDLDFDLRNNDDRPMLVAVFGGAGEEQKELLRIPLASRGERAEFSLPRVYSPVSFKVLAVGEVGAPQAKRAMVEVDVPSYAVEVDTAGATRYVYPNNFTPAREQPSARIDVAMKQSSKVQLSTQRIPGLGVD